MRASSIPALPSRKINSALSSRTRWLARRLARTWLAMRVLALVLVLPAVLQVVPVARLVPALTPRRACTAPDTQFLSLIVHIVHWLSTLRALGAGDTGVCLRRSVAIYYAATRTGHAVQLVIGVRQEATRITGHAWLECDGLPFCEPGSDPRSRFVVMQRLP